MKLFDFLFRKKKTPHTEEKLSNNVKANFSGEVLKRKQAEDKQNEAADTMPSANSANERAKNKKNAVGASTVKEPRKVKQGTSETPDNKQKSPSSSGRFEIKKTSDGRYVFNLYASNGNIIATSQVYTSSSSAVNGINSVTANAGRAPIEDQSIKEYTVLPYPKWEIYIDKAGEYRFRLSAPNGNCICHSQGYTAKSSCKKGIESIKRFSPNATIDKKYVKRD